MELEFMAEDPQKDGELFLYLNQDGLKILAKAIENAKITGHEHLSAPEWGGTELTVSEGSLNSFKKVTITFLTDRVE